MLLSSVLGYSQVPCLAACALGSVAGGKRPGHSPQRHSVSTCIAGARPDSDVFRLAGAASFKTQGRGIRRSVSRRPVWIQLGSPSAHARIMARGQLPNDQPGETIQVATQSQLRQGTVQSVRCLADILNKKDCPLPSRSWLRTHDRRQYGQIPPHQRPREGPRADRGFEVVRPQRRASERARRPNTTLKINISSAGRRIAHRAPSTVCL